MVKIVNVFGDVLTGVSGPAIYQRHYGKQIRRKGYKQTKPPSAGQLAVRSRFSSAINWVKGLSADERLDIKEYYKSSSLAYRKTLPKTWYNYAKLLYLADPELAESDLQPGDYVIKHPAILSIEQYDTFHVLISAVENLTDFSEDSVCNEYTLTALPESAILRVYTYPGLYKEFAIAPVSTELMYYDIRYYDGTYFQ